MPTCTAPTPASPITMDHTGSTGWMEAWGTLANQDGCLAPAPLTCQGPTEWPPATSWQRYAQDRADGQRVPPSVSTWREQDRRRQAAAEREIREQAPAREPVAVPWGPGPSCDSGVR